MDSQFSSLSKMRFSVVVAFFSHARILGKCSTTHSLSALFVFLFFEVESGRAYSYHSLDQDQSRVAQRAEMTVAECSLTSCELVSR